MDLRIKNFTEGKKLDKQFSDWLSTLEEADSVTVGRLVEILKPSLNQLKDFSSLAREISNRDNTSIAAQFESEEALAVLENEKLSRNDKLNSIGKILRDKRFPFKAELEKRLTKLQSDIRKNHGLKIEYPKDLEGVELKISISGKSPADFKEKSRQLEALSESKELEQIFSELLGESEKI